MSRREKMNERIENASIAQALAELIEKNQVLTIELKSLAQLVDVETAAAQERDAEQTARLGEALGELADAKAAVEIERVKRIEAEEIAAGLIAAADGFKAALARFPSAIPGAIRDAADDEREVATVQGAAIPAAIPPTGAAPGGETSDRVAAENDEHRFAAADADQGTVSIMVNLSPAEAMALETFAAHDGNGGSVDAAAGRLIRDGLRRSGWKPAAGENRSRRE